MPCRYDANTGHWIPAYSFPIHLRATRAYACGPRPIRPFSIARAPIKQCDCTLR